VRARIGHQVEVLSSAPLFSGLPRRDLHEIAKVSSEATFRPGEVVVKEGVAGSVMYVILEGRAKVTRDGRTLKRFGPGEFFGELSVLTDTSRTASVLAETDLHCLTLAGKDFKGVLRKEPALAVRILSRLAERLVDLAPPGRLTGRLPRPTSTGASEARSTIAPWPRSSTWTPTGSGSSATRSAASSGPSRAWTA
jgi:CRP-like cAMP-binding protein